MLMDPGRHVGFAAPGRSIRTDLGLLLLQPPPHIESTPTVSEMGVKTKTQLLAERAVLRQLITSVIAASADKDLNPKGRPSVLL